MLIDEKNKLQEKVGSSLDGELSHDESMKLEQHIESCPEELELSHMLQTHLASRVEKAAATIDFDAFASQLAAKIELEAPCIAAPVQERTVEPVIQSEPSIWDTLRSWFVAHPRFALAAAASFAVALLFALTSLDPGPTKTNQKQIANKIEKGLDQDAKSVAANSTKDQKTPGAGKEDKASLPKKRQN